MFLHVGLLMVLGYGYQMVRLFPPFGIPLSEVLLLYFMILSRPWNVLGKLRTVLPLTPFLGWILYGSVLVLLGISEHGWRAVRDGSPVFEASFLYVGFLIAGRPGALPALTRWLPWLLGLGLVYALLYPLRDLLVPLSPQVTGVQGQSVPLLFTFTNTNTLLMVLAAYALAGALRRHDPARLVVGAFALLVVVVLFPSRTLILMIGAVALGFLAYGGRSWLLHLAWIVGVLVLISPLLFSLGLETRLGAFDLTSYLTLFLEIFDFRSGEGAQLLSSGSALRIGWWIVLLEQWASSWRTILFGAGYGRPLMDFVATGGIVVYEPHNTLVSVLCRTGAVGVVLFVWLHGFIVHRAVTVAARYRNDPRYASTTMALLAVLLCVLINSIGQTPFVMPMYAVPYYFSAGVLLRMAYALRRDAAVQAPRDTPGRAAGS